MSAPTCSDAWDAALLSALELAVLPRFDLTHREMLNHCARGYAQAAIATAYHEACCWSCAAMMDCGPGDRLRAEESVARLALTTRVARAVVR